MRPRRGFAALLVMAMVSVTVATMQAPALAASITVTTGSDAIAVDGGCSLREAITAAKGDTTVNECVVTTPGADTITFAGDTTIALTSRLPVISGNITIDGSGFDVVLDGQTTTGSNGTSILRVETNGILALNGLTVTRGRSQGCDGGDTCGAVLNYGTLRVNRSTFSGNQGNGFTNGIAITSRRGILDVDRSTFANNRAVSSGAIWNASDGSGILTSATISNSTFSGNSGGNGGAIYNTWNAQMVITNSTFVDTTANQTIQNAGGPQALLTLQNSIVMAASGTPGIACGQATAFTVSNSFDDDGTCSATTSASLDLQPLADNGGPTQTIALGATSDAIDAGDNTVCAAAPINNIDQRGEVRPVGSACDAGAFELDTAISHTFLGGTANWNDGASWDTGLVPDANDTATINSGSVNIAGAQQVGKLVIGAGGDATILVAASLTLTENGGANGETDSAIAGTLNIQPTGAFTVATAFSDLTLNGQIINNADGQIVLAGGSDQVSSSTLAGSGDIQNEGTLSASYGSEVLLGSVNLTSSSTSLLEAAAADGTLTINTNYLELGTMSIGLNGSIAVYGSFAADPAALIEVKISDGQPWASVSFNEVTVPAFNGATFRTNLVGPWNGRRTTAPAPLVCDDCGAYDLTLDINPAWVPRLVPTPEITPRDSIRLAAAIEPIAHWTFDEASSGTGTGVVIDAAGGPDAPISGAAEYVPGIVGSGALSFDGIDDFIDAGLRPELDLLNDSYTIAFWVKSPTGGVNPRIISKDDGNNTSGGYSVFARATNQCCIFTHNAGPVGHTQTTFLDPFGTDWRHVAIVYEGVSFFNTSPQLTFYYDGVDQGTFGVAGDLASDGNDNLVIGAIPVHGQFLDGALDDVRLYNDLLYPDEILALATPVSPASPPPPVDFAATIGGSGTDIGNDVAVDQLGNVTTVGYFEGTVDFEPGAGATNLTSAIGDDGYAYQLDAAGDLVWAAQFAGASAVNPTSVDVDGSGNVYVAGQFAGTVDFDPGVGVANETAVNTRDVFLVKLDAFGDFVWVQIITGPNTVENAKVAVSETGDVALAGSYTGTVDLDPGAAVANAGPSLAVDSFVVTLDPAGDFVWSDSSSTTTGSPTHVMDISLDDSGDVYVVGYFFGTTTIGGDTFASSGLNDGWVAHYDNSGSATWTGVFGGTGADAAASVAVDAGGTDIRVGGTFSATADLDPGAGVSNATATTGSDAFIARLDGAGDLVGTSLLAGTANISMAAVRFGSDGSLYFNGNFSTGDLDLDPGPAAVTVTAITGPFPSYGDVFVGQLDAGSALVWAGSIGGNDLDQFLQRGLAVDSAGNAYLSGWFWQTADFDPGAGVLNRTSAGGGDAFLVKIGDTQLVTASNVSFDVADDSGTPGQTQVGVGAVNILDIPIESIVGGNGASYESAPLGSIPLGSIPLGSIDLDASPLGSIPLGSIPLGSIPLGSIPLGSIPLGSIPLGSIGGWGEALVGTAFEGKPLQTVTLGDVLALDPLPAGVAAVSLSDIAVQDSPLGSISLPSISLGDQELLAIDPTLCDDPALSAFDCSNPATDSLLELQLASAPLGSIPLGSIPLGSIPLGSIPLGSIPLGSIPLGSIPLGSIPLGSINLDTAPLGSIPLGSIDLQGAPLGSIPLGSIPLGSIAAFDCSTVPAPSDCASLGLDPSTATIAEYIAELPTGTTIDASPLGSIPLGSIPLGSIPLGSIPLGSIPLGSIDLLGAPLGSIPLGSIPLGSIPLGSIDLNAAPLGSIPLGSIPLGSIPLGSIPLGSIGDLGGCAALSPSTVDCDALGLTDGSSASAFLASLPSGMTLEAFIGELPTGTTISDTPLGSIPLGSIPLGSIPLGSIPLGSIPLGSIGLDSVSLARSPLGSIPLGSIPLGSIPLGSIGDGGGCAALSPSAVDCPTLGLGDGSSIVDFVAALPAGMTMNEFVTALPTATTIADSPLGSIPLGSIPLGSIPLGSIDLQTVEIKGAPLGSIPLGSIGLNGTGVAASPLGSIPLGSIDLDATPLGSIPLGSIPLGSIPLGSIPLGSIPLGSIPLGSIPLGSISTVVDCSLVDCTADSLGDAAAAGAIVAGATLADLGEYGQTTLGQLGEYGTTDLGEIGQYGTATLGELGTYGDTTLGDLATYGAGAFGAMTLADLDNLLTLDLLYGDGALGDLGNDYGDLTFGQILVSTLLQSDFPWETLPLADLGLQEIAPTGTVDYGVSFDLAGDAGTTVVGEVRAAIPDDFHVVLGGARLFRNGALFATIDDPVSTMLAGEPVLTFTIELDAGASYELVFSAVPGFRTGTWETSATVSLNVAIDGSDTDSTTIEVSEWFTGNNGFAAAIDIAADTLVFSHVSTQRTSDYFSFEPGPIGTRHAVFVSQFDVDSDVVLYKPATEQISEVTARDVPLGSLPIDDDGADYAGTGTQEPEVQGDIDIQAAPIGSISINRGTTLETVESTLSAAPIDPADPYVIQVSGYQGAVSDTPYVVRVRREQLVTAPTCPATTFPNGAASGIDLSLLPVGLNTVFLFNYERTVHQYGVVGADAIAASLDALILDGANGVVGAVIPIDEDVDVQTAYGAWDASPCDTDLANNVVGAVTDLLAQIRTVRPTVGFVTIVGNDDMVPFARIDDVTSIANESTFTEQFSDGALLGALATRHYLSDDPYGDIDPIRWLDRRLHLPEIALGRLVESPADISSALDRFVTFGGQLDPQTAAVGGYDFLADGSTVIFDRLTNIYGAAFTSAMIDGAGTPAAGAWTLADLLGFLDLSDSTPGIDTADIISINAHSDQFRQLPSFGDANHDENDLFDVDDIGSLPADSLAGDIVFTMGCHAGLSVSDVSVATSNSTDWAQTYAGQGALYVGNSGFGYGDTVSVALSERLMAEFAENLDGSMTAGQAMAFAKQEYFAQLGQYGPYDEKAIQQVIFYGLPMYAVGTAPPPEPPAPLPTALYPSLSLRAAVLDLAPVYETHVTPGTGTYLSIDGQTQNTQFRPIQPVETFDISQDPTELLAHGAIVTEATTTDISGFDPVYFRPNITGAAEREPETPGDEISTEIFNLTIATYNGPGTGPNGEPFRQQQQATLTAGSFRSPADGSQLGQQRTINEAEVVVVYADPSSTDFTAPHISSVDSALVADQVSFTVTTDATDVAAALVLYRQSSSGAVSHWTSATLVPEPGGNTFSGGGSVDQSAVVNNGVDFKVWVIDTSGNVSSSDAKNELWQAEPLPAPSVPAEIALDMPTPQSGTWYTGEVTVPFVGVPGVTYTITGAGPAPTTIVGSGDVIIAGDGVHQVIIEGGGLTAAFSVLIDATDPQLGSSSVASGAIVPAGEPLTFEYECVDAGSGIADGGCTAEIGATPLTPGTGTALQSGDSVNTSTGNASYDVIVTAIDDLGNTSTSTVTFTVEGAVDHLPEIVLIDAPTVPQLITDGVFIDVEFDDENGTYDDYTVTIDWGNLDVNETPGSSDTCTATSSTGTTGNPSCSIVAEPTGTGTGDGVVIAEFEYPAPGVYPITVTISDSAGNVVQSIYEFVVVYDPEAGRVSGAGIFWSGPEAYADSGPWGSPAYFGYRARYRGNDPEPRGRTKLRLFGEFFFKSTGNDYLIINDTLAITEGVGKLNGQPGYRFRVQAIDNGWVDFFQITIWHETTGEVIYDNGVLYDSGDRVLLGGIRVKS